MERPAVTLVLMTTNQGPYLAESLDSALAQDYPRLTVLVTDNASQDETGALLEAAGRRPPGRHRLRTHRFATPLGGPAAHMTAALALVEDPLVVMQHGDDRSEPRRVSRLVEAFADPAVLLVHSAATVIDAAGRVIGERRGADPPPPAQAAHYARVQGHVLGATLALRRALLERFPPLDDRAFEDTTLPFRAALAGRIGYLPEPLLRYRRHGRNVTQALHDLSSPAAAATAAGGSLQRLRIIAELRRADLAHWCEDHPAVPRAALEQVIAASLAEAEATTALHDRRLGRRLRAAAALAARGRSGRGAALALFQALAPGAYVAWRRRRRQAPH